MSVRATVTSGLDKIILEAQRIKSAVNGGYMVNYSLSQLDADIEELCVSLSRLRDGDWRSL